MAILNKEQFMQALKTRIGESTSEEDLRFLEDMTDTFNSLQKESNIDWKEKYENLDKEWSERYKARFFHGSDKLDENNNSNTSDPMDEPKEDQAPEDAKLEDQYLASVENVSGNVVKI